MALKTSFLFAPLLFTVACAANVGPGGGDDGFDPNDPSDPSDPSQPVSRVAGDYDVTTTFDFTNSPALPSLVGDIVGPLSGLSDDPAGTIIDLVKQNSNLLDDVPDFLLDLVANELNNVIQDELLTQGSNAEKIVEYTDLISSMLTQFEVVSTMQVGNEDEAGNANATHQLSAVAFPNADGSRNLVDTPALIDALTVARDVSVNVSLSGSAGTIDIGNHALNLPLGDFALQGLEAALQSQFGAADLEAALTQVISCSDLAARVGDLDLGIVTIGQGQIEDLCDTGLAQAANAIEDQIAKIDFAALNYTGGSAQVSLGKADGTSTDKVGQMTGGSWDSQLDLNGNTLDVPATFTATRR